MRPPARRAPAGRSSRPGTRMRSSRRGAWSPRTLRQLGFRGQLAPTRAPVSNISENQDTSITIPPRPRFQSPFGGWPRRGTGWPGPPEGARLGARSGRPARGAPFVQAFRGSTDALSTPGEQDQAEAFHRVPCAHEDDQRAEDDQPEAPQGALAERRRQVSPADPSSNLSPGLPGGAFASPDVHARRFQSHWGPRRLHIPREPGQRDP